MTFHDWWTNENNPTLPRSEYLFGTRHIIIILVAVLLAITLSVIFYKKSERAKWILLRIIASILLFFEILSRVVNLIIANSYTVESVCKIILPMHICSVAVWVLIIAVFSKNKLLLNFASIVGLIATISFLTFPAAGINRTYISFTCLYSIVSHMLGFVASILLLTLKLTSYEFKDFWKTFLCFVLMFAWGVLLDFVIFPGSDYMYLRNDPLELNLGFPYQILYAVLLTIYILLVYWLSAIIKKFKSKRV